MHYRPSAQSINVDQPLRQVKIGLFYTVQQQYFTEGNSIGNVLPEIVTGLRMYVTQHSSW